MLGLMLTAVFLVAATVAIHAFGTTYWIRYLVHRFAAPDGYFKVRHGHGEIDGYGSSAQSNQERLRH
jgi:hypothetical protein